MSVLYELRRYRIQTGCMAAMHERMRHTLFPLFEQCGVPRPIGIWDALGGSRLPQLVWLLRWQSYEQRAAAWATLYPRWQALRPATLADEEFVLSNSITLMTPWPELGAPDREVGGGVDELWIRQIASTQGGRARQTFLETDLPALRRAGATITGGFDLLFGEELPRSALFLSWPDEESRGAGLAAYDSAPEVRDAHHRDKLAFGRPVVESTERIPLRPAPYL